MKKLREMTRKEYRAYRNAWMRRYRLFGKRTGGERWRQIVLMFLGTL